MDNIADIDWNHYRRISNSSSEKQEPISNGDFYPGLFIAKYVDHFRDYTKTFDVEELRDSRHNIEFTIKEFQETLESCSQLEQPSRGSLEELLRDGIESCKKQINQLP